MSPIQMWAKRRDFLLFSIGYGPNPENVLVITKSFEYWKFKWLLYLLNLFFFGWCLEDLCFLVRFSVNYPFFDCRRWNECIGSFWYDEKYFNPMPIFSFKLVIILTIVRFSDLSEYIVNYIRPEYHASGISVFWWCDSKFLIF